MNANVKFMATGFVAGLLAIWLMASADVGRQAVAQTGAAPAGVEWEYNSISVDAPSIQTQLAMLGTAGWEVFSVTSTDGMVESNGADGKPHVITQRFEVTAKRIKKK